MATTAPAVDVYALSAKTLEGQPAPLAKYRGQVTLLVNVASAWLHAPICGPGARLHEVQKPALLRARFPEQ